MLEFEILLSDSFNLSRLFENSNINENEKSIPLRNYDKIKNDKNKKDEDLSNISNEIQSNQNEYKATD